ncbi:hypothetical protein TNCV_1373341 [Trichonephila clavipes]|uniref:Uncharacterized protein n=1 Tax=Trichonephila clavipes TaxID=2585209 RepID=A0A8X6WGI3_TRICX|nr:hypothetical protein TNCV_1373341 [Trichonephila clavipes]
MKPSSSFVNPTPLAHADTPRDILPYHKLILKGREEDNFERQQPSPPPGVSSLLFPFCKTHVVPDSNNMRF